jgi:DNA-binding NarL/FixJ family response regulator
MPTRLLIVDDSEQIRSRLRALLNSVPGITRIHEAQTLDQALDSVRRDPPTLVILDMSLPDGLGMNIIQPLKLLTPAVLIAVLTMHGHVGIRKHCLELGADWFFDKFSDIDALLKVVRQHAARKPLLDGQPETPMRQLSSANLNPAQCRPDTAMGLTAATTP